MVTIGSVWAHRHTHTDRCMHAHTHTHAWAHTHTHRAKLFVVDELQQAGTEDL